VQVSGLTGTITAISAGYIHTAALKSDGTVWTWGSNQYGQLGDGTKVDELTPVQVSGLTGITAIAAGEFHTVALKNDGTVWAWGLNDHGQLGSGGLAISLIPVQVKLNSTTYLTGITAIAAGEFHTVALGVYAVPSIEEAPVVSSNVWAWGLNNHGQLGDGTTTDQPTPVQVTGLTGNITAIAAGEFHTIALRNDGTVWDWGYNSVGQLGNGTTTNSVTPVNVPW
jgi:alpha-tubulin suppressor-like RCC1 family protein